MKNFATGLLLMLALSLCQSCDQKQSNASATGDKKEMAKRNKKSNKEKRKIKTAPMGVKKGDGMTAGKNITKKRTRNNKYWESIAKELKIEEDTLKMMRDINKKNNEKVKAIREKSPADERQKVKKIRNAERNQMKKLLGDELYQKKLEWDKTWDAAEQQTKTGK